MARGEPRRIECPRCGMPDAELLFQLPRCLNPDCQFYDRSLESSRVERERTAELDDQDDAELRDRCPF